MKATYEDFKNEVGNANCSGYFGNEDMEELFNFLSEDNHIIRMIEMTEMQKPALAGCAKDVESWFLRKNNPKIDLADGFTRTVIGRLVKTILKPFGYEVTKQKDMPKGLDCKFFASASCYKKTGIATMHIVKRIEEMKCSNEL